MILAERSLDWKPKSKERPRFRKAGNRVITYTPKATVKAQDALAAQWGDEEPIEGPIDVQIELFGDHVYVTIDRTADYKHRTLRADVDNYAKLILDALNGVAFVDDRQIVKLTVEKL